MSDVAQPSSDHVYTYRAWVPAYAFWLGVLLLIGLNLLGIAWLVWSKNMRTTPCYQPRWMYWVHWVVVPAYSAALLLVIYRGVMEPEATFSFRIFGAKAAELNIWWSPPFLLIFIVIFSVGLCGIRRERRSGTTGA